MEDASGTGDMTMIRMRFETTLKMPENRPEDTLGSLVKTVETVETERKILKYLTL